MHIYIACALTHVPREKFSSYASFIHDLATHLEKLPGCDVKYALKHSDPQLAAKPFAERARLCYLWDREMVEQAEIVVAEATYPSLGLGIELQIADNRRTPIVLCFDRAAEHRATPITYENPDRTHHSLQIGEGYISLMALGLPSIYKVVPYATREEGASAVSDAVTLLRRTPRE